MRHSVRVGAVVMAGVLAVAAAGGVADATTGPDLAVLSEWRALCFDTNGDSAKVQAVASARGWVRDPSTRAWRKTVEPFGTVELAIAGYAGPIYKTFAVTHACGLRLRRPPRDLASQVSAALGSAPGRADQESQEPSTTWYFQTVQGARAPISAPDDGEGEGSFDALVARAPVTIVTLRRDGQDTLLVSSFTYVDTRPPQS